MQTVINARMPVACAGLPAEPFAPQHIRTRAAEGGNIPFGLAVVQGTAENQAKLPTVNTQKVRGVTMFTNAIESSAGVNAPGYKEKDAMNVMAFGPIWVQYDGTAPALDAAIYVVASGGAAGKVTATSTSNIATDWKVRQVDTSLGLALVHIPTVL